MAQTFLPVLTEVEKASLSERQPLPARYRGLDDEEMDRRIAAARAALGSRLLILGHHYQRDEVIKFADFIGDSFRLSRQCAARSDAEYIVFCGVHFMAESADVLSADHQQVILPDLAAGCSMADMADADDLESLLAGPRRDGHRLGDSRHLHQLVGRHQSLRRRARRHRLHVGQRVGGAEVGVGARRADPVPARPAPGTQHRLQDGRAARPDGRLGSARARRRHHAAKQGRAARLLLWKGHCSVHTRFTAQQIALVREQHPGVRVIVHPEVPWDVVQAADDSGSTEHILKPVRESPAGSIWAVGTEVHLVNRLANEVAPDKTVLSLDQMGCLCSTMFRVSPNHLLWVLEELLEGRVQNRIVVPDAQKHWVRVSLDRMLQAV